MANEVSIYEPRTMGKVISRMPEAHTFIKSTFFRNVQTFNTKSVDVDFKKGNRALAPFVNRKIGGKLIPNSGYSTKTYSPPLIAPKKLTTVDDLLARSPGETLYSGKSPAERAVEKLAADFSELSEMITRREEWMAAQAIFTGKIPVVGDGIDEVIDFNFTNYEEVIAAGDKWDSPTADPFRDLAAWQEEVQKNGFVTCNICIMARDVAAAFINNPTVKELLDIKNYELAVIKPKELPSGARFIGTIGALGIDIYTYNEWYLDDWTDPDAPEQKPLVPDGTLALISTNAQYSIYYGAITLLDAQTKNFYTVEGSRVPNTWIQNDPDRRFLSISSSPLPVPHEVDSWYVAKVL
jgi:hypothetical protein